MLPANAHSWREGGSAINSEAVKNAHFGEHLHPAQRPKRADVDAGAAGERARIASGHADNRAGGLINDPSIDPPVSWSSRRIQP